MARAYERDAWTYTGPARSSPFIRPGMSTSDWDYARRQQESADKQLPPTLTADDLSWLKQFPEFGGKDRTANTTGTWGGTSSNAFNSWTDTAKKQALDNRLGESAMSKDNNWSNPPTPAPQSETGGGFVPGPAPSRGLGTRDWSRMTPRSTRAPIPAAPPITSAPIIDLPAPPTPPAQAAPPKVAPGPGGFVESFTPVSMPSVDQLYKTYQSVFGNQGAEYINSPQFKSILESGNVPWWMLSDPRWRKVLIDAGVLNWDALRKRLGE